MVLKVIGSAELKTHLGSELGETCLHNPAPVFVQGKPKKLFLRKAQLPSDPGKTAACCMLMPLEGNRFSIFSLEPYSQSFNLQSP